jgi:hypothetical protein
MSGCRQDDANTTQNAPAFAVNLTDDNNDGFPDGWDSVGPPAYRDDYEIILILEIRVISIPFRQETS